MTEPSMEEPPQHEIDHLRTQNRRYRELIQNLSSAVETVRHRLETVLPSTSRLRAFEEFGGERKPPVIARTYGSGATSVIRRLLRRPQNQAPSDLGPLTPNPGWKCLAAELPQLKIGFTLFGMTAEEVENAVSEVEHRQLRSRDFTPVFVTDNPDLSPFRSRGYVAEYIPSMITSSALEGRDEHRHLGARVEYIRSKWGLGKIVDLGQSHR